MDRKKALRLALIVLAAGAGAAAGSGLLDPSIAQVLNALSLLLGAA